MRNRVRVVTPAGALISGLSLLAGVPACSGSGDTSVVENIAGDGTLTSTTEAVTTDGLAEAYAFFKSMTFRPNSTEQELVLGAGHHGLFSTEELKANGVHASAWVRFTLSNAGRIIGVEGYLSGLPDRTQLFDLWLVKNDKLGGNAKPEDGDSAVRIGTFDKTPPPPEPPAEYFRRDERMLELKAEDLPEEGLPPFDPDMLVVTRAGKKPRESRVLVGDRTLFEKRFWRELLGKSMDPVTGTLSNIVETTDPLVRRGAQLFFVETFGGNGRTCGTCHRLTDNLTISPAFIATLPQDDPLFVHENNPALAGLENRNMLRQRALFIENVDGFNVTNPPLRSANHTFALGTTNDFLGGRGGKYPFNPPRHRLGWGGDGAPGAGTLHEFALGAIVQHLPKRLNRVAGTDFRIPTQQELDALEAFQLFTGRQKMVNPAALVFRDATAVNGSFQAQGRLERGKCAACHFELQGGLMVNENFDIGTRTRMTDIPPDDGFLQPLTNRIPELNDEEMQRQQVPGVGLMNIPPLTEAADTGPFFHNNSAQTIEDVVQHYRSEEFAKSRDAERVDGVVDISNDDARDIAIFLRELNALENMRQVRKRATFVKLNRSGGNTTILTVAIRDTQDAIDVLAAKNLNLAARKSLATVKQALLQGQAQPDANRPGYMDTVLSFLKAAKNSLLVSDPNNDF